MSNRFARYWSGRIDRRSRNTTVGGIVVVSCVIIACALIAHASTWQRPVYSPPTNLPNQPSLEIDYTKYLATREKNLQTVLGPMIIGGAAINGKPQGAYRAWVGDVRGVGSYGMDSNSHAPIVGMYSFTQPLSSVFDSGTTGAVGISSGSTKASVVGYAQNGSSLTTGVLGEVLSTPTGCRTFIDSSTCGSNRQCVWVNARCIESPAGYFAGPFQVINTTNGGGQNALVNVIGRADVTGRWMCCTGCSPQCHINGSQLVVAEHKGSGIGISASRLDTAGGGAPAFVVTAMDTTRPQSMKFFSNTGQGLGSALEDPGGNSSSLFEPGLNIEPQGVFLADWTGIMHVMEGIAETITPGQGGIGMAGYVRPTTTTSNAQACGAGFVPPGISLIGGLGWYNASDASADPRQWQPSAGISSCTWKMNSATPVPIYNKIGIEAGANGGNAGLFPSFVRKCSNSATAACTTSADCGSGNTCLDAALKTCSNDYLTRCTIDANCGSGNTCTRIARMCANRNGSNQIVLCTQDSHCTTGADDYCKPIGGTVASVGFCASSQNTRCFQNRSCGIGGKCMNRVQVGKYFLTEKNIRCMYYKSTMPTSCKWWTVAMGATNPNAGNAACSTVMSTNNTNIKNFLVYSDKDCMTPCTCDATSCVSEDQDSCDAR